jgi:hypothetical protein
MAHIKGVYVDESGFNAGRGMYLIEVAGDRITDVETGEALRCEQWGGDCPILTNGCWQFWPDESELARLLIVPVQMIAAGAS